MTDTCALCPRPLPAESMCRHGRWLCDVDCRSWCVDEGEDW